MKHLLSALGLLTALSTTTVSAQSPASTRAEHGCLPDTSLVSLYAQNEVPRAFEANDDGIVVIEIETEEARVDWVERTDRPGFSGASFFRWEGPNHFSRPGIGILTYRVFVEEAGRYQVRIHNRHDHPDSSEANDCWMRVNRSSWIKTYSNNGNNSGAWNWHFRFDPGHGAVAYNLDAGVNEIQISGRSNGFMIDRLVVFPSNQNGQDLSIPPSARLKSRPVLGSTMRIEANDQAGAAGITPGASTFVLLLSPLAHDGCGIRMPGMGRSGDGVMLLSNSVAPLEIPFSGLYQGPSNPIGFDLPITNAPALVGRELYVQGVFLDGSTGSLRGALTNRLDLVLGDF
ncbi:MAG: hypothetical protein AAF196_13060 [Planctomycetota bacterium]